MSARWVSLLSRLCLVCLFLPSALDKLIHRGQALKQARSGPLPGAPLLLEAAIVVELVASVCIVTGRHDRLAAGMLAGFCAVIAVLYHPFWIHGDLGARGSSKGREEFWSSLRTSASSAGCCWLYLGKDIPLSGTAHQDGTMRFGTDPATSVLDLDYKAHEPDSLYVTDASFFPSIGAVNPTLSIIADALRVADGIGKRLA